MKLSILKKLIKEEINRTLKEESYDESEMEEMAFVESELKKYKQIIDRATGTSGRLVPIGKVSWLPDFLDPNMVTLVYPVSTGEIAFSHDVNEAFVLEGNNEATQDLINEMGGGDSQNMESLSEIGIDVINA
jgi:hypothetical protein